MVRSIYELDNFSITLLKEEKKNSETHYTLKWLVLFKNSHIQLYLKKKKYCMALM